MVPDVQIATSLDSQRDPTPGIPVGPKEPKEREIATVLEIIRYPKIFPIDLGGQEMAG